MCHCHGTEYNYQLSRLGYWRK